MVLDDPGQRVTVHVGSCPCPGTPHTSGDEVYLAPEANVWIGLAGNGAIAAAGGDPALLEILLGQVFIEYGIVGWTFVDEKGEPIPITRGIRDEPTPEFRNHIVRLLPWGKGGSLVAEKANDLYGEAVIAPLARTSLNTSALMQTNGSTSHTRPSRAVRRNSSRSSSRGSSGIPR